MAEISMKVTALSDYCKNCPELEIEVDTDSITMETFSIDPPYGLMSNTEYHNTLKCKHYGRCVGIKCFVESKEKSQEKHGL